MPLLQKVPKRDDGVAEIVADYGFMGDGETKCLPILVLKDRVHDRLAATYVDSKGTSTYAVKFVRNFLKE